MNAIASRVKSAVITAASVMALTVVGLAGQAQAFSFGENDLVLAIYGNNTEALVNLGNYNTLLANNASATFNVSAELAAAQVGGAPVKYTLFGWDVSLPNGQLHAATAFAPGSIPTGGINLTNQFNPSVNMAFLPSFTGNTIAKADTRSFSSNLNTAGAGFFEGAWTVAMQGNLDQLMNILRGNVETNTFTRVGGLLLTANGQLTIGNPGPSAVPLPAGVVLFGTGLIGLVGMARRSFNRMQA
jgi:hypothetical protein